METTGTSSIICNHTPNFCLVRCLLTGKLLLLAETKIKSRVCNKKKNNVWRQKCLSNIKPSHISVKQLEKAIDTINPK